MGALHLRKLVTLPSVQVVGFFDPNPQRLEEISAHYGVPAFRTMEELLFEADAVTIASPTSTHYKFAKQALEAGTHVFVEKPMCETALESEDLIRTADAHKLVLQAGFLERFRLEKILPRDSFVGKPMLLECQRLAVAVGREPDIDVVSDVMIHDIDLVLSIAGETPIEVEAQGVSVVTPYPDIVHATLRFPSGCVALLTASRVAEKLERRLRISTATAHYSLNFLTNEVDSYSRDDGNRPKRLKEESHTVDPLYDELFHFANCCQQNRAP